MNRIKAFFKDWSTLEKAWLAFVLVFQTVAWAIQREDLFMLVLTLSSSLNLVLGAKGKIAGLYFAILNSLLYAINCFSIPLYGEIMYNLLYSIPVSATAIILWRKNQSQTGEVKFRTMTTLFALGTIGATGMGTLAYARILAWMGGNFAWMDSLTTVVSVIASMLYLLRYSVAHVGDCQCVVHCDVDSGISVRKYVGSPDYHYEVCESLQCGLRILELEKNCRQG